MEDLPIYDSISQTFRGTGKGREQKKYKDKRKDLLDLERIRVTKILNMTILREGFKN